MELVDGQPLSARLASGPLAPDEVVRYATQLADALAQAHDRGIVHRDLKSANVILTPDGRAKILDFGLAKRVPTSELEAATRSERSLTEAGTVMGTLAYMAPERLRGEPADARSWAFGVMLYEMAAGERPFQGSPAFQLASAIMTQEPPPLPPRVPAGVRAVIERCLQREPARRYQRAGEVRTALEILAEGSAVPVQGVEDVPGRRRLVWFGAVTLLQGGIPVLALDVGGVRSRVSRPAAPVPTSLAVLPLKNLTGDPEQDYLVEGTHEALVAELSKIGGLKVVSRTSTLLYRDAKKRMPQIARELGVSGLIEGSVARAGNQVRVTVQLIDGPADRHLWGESYQREFRDILSLQAELAQAIAAAVRVQVGPQRQASLASARPVNPAALEAYLRGQFVFQPLERDAPQNRQAIDWFERAVELDPDFAAGHAARARAYIARFFTHDPRREWEEKAYVEIGKALALDPGLALAYVARAELSWTLSNGFPHERAIQDYRRALALSPSLPDAHFGIGLVYMHIGLLEEALRHLRTAVDLDPHRLEVRVPLPRVYLYQQDYQAALAEFDRADYPRLWQWGKALALAYLRRDEEALALLEEIKAESPREPDVVGAYAVVLAKTGQGETALTQIQVAEDLDRGQSHFHHTAYSIASAYALMGKKRAALSWLDRTAQDGLPGYPPVRKGPQPGLAPQRAGVRRLPGQDARALGTLPGRALIADAWPGRAITLRARFPEGEKTNGSTLRILLSTAGCHRHRTRTRGPVRHDLHGRGGEGGGRAGRGARRQHAAQACVNGRVQPSPLRPISRAMRTSYLVCYDISDEKRLAKVAKAMRGFGDRIQYSVFECQLTPADLARCRHRLSELIDHRADQVIFVDLGPVEGRGERVITALGRPYTPIDSPCIVVDGVKDD